jgi:hypothetical protein
MPHFSPEGNDMYICQVCGRDLDSVKFPPTWRIDITIRPGQSNKGLGNVCPKCISKEKK